MSVHKRCPDGLTTAAPRLGKTSRWGDGLHGLW
jgi:hypothetical protein